MTAALPLPDAADLWESFSYNPLTGILYWIKTNTPACRSRTDKRYYRIKAFGRELAAHRVVWKWVTGQEPNGVVEHIEDNGLDNRFWRLKSSTHRDNNQTASRLKSVVPVGASQIRTGRWRSQLAIEGVKYLLGCYDSPEEASAVYYFAVKQLSNNSNWRPT